MTKKPYLPQDLFSGNAAAEQSPRVIISPHRYIQGNGVLNQIGHYLSVLNSKKPALLITEGGIKRTGQVVVQSLKKAGLEPILLYFQGECSDQEVARHTDHLQHSGVDSLIAVGGGKCLDTGKCVAFCASVPVVICPTLASTDAPCSAVSVMYTPEGKFNRPWFFPESPALVVVDSGVIAKAPLRYLVAGMGDAMATCYEARTCFKNPKARNMIGARPSATALGISELCAKLLFRDGLQAIAAMKQATINQALENVIEANILLSGMGFESGGLAASHGVAQVFPVIPFLEEQYLHGEMVALGALIHLCLEEDETEAQRVAEFFAKVGLPTHLAQLSLDLEKHQKELDLIFDAALRVFFLHHEPFAVTKSKLKSALIKANTIGLNASKKIGDEAYRSLKETSHAY